MIVFVFVFLLRNVDLYIYFFLLCGLNSTWYVRLYVCSPHAPSSKQGQASSHSNHLTQPLIRTQSESRQNLFQSTEMCFFKFHLFGQRREIGVRVRDCETELYFMCKCAISQNREILNLNNTMVFFFFFYNCRLRSTYIMFNFLLSGAQKTRKAWKFPSKM